MKLQICAEDTSPSLDTTAIDDSSLVISNEDENYGTVFGVKMVVSDRFNKEECLLLHIMHLNFNHTEEMLV